MRSKRLRTTEEPVDLDGNLTLNSSKRKNMGTHSGSKVQRSVVGKTCKELEKGKKKEAESKHNQNSDFSQFSGRTVDNSLPQILCGVPSVIRSLRFYLKALHSSCSFMVAFNLSFYPRQVLADRCVWLR